MSEHPFKDAAILVKPFKVDHSDQSLDDPKAHPPTMVLYINP